MALNGNFSYEMIDSANLYVKGLISNDYLNEKQNKIASDISKNTKLDGFRKGKIPLKIVNARFADKIKKDAEQEVLSDIILDAMKENNIQTSKILGSPVIKKYDVGNNGIDIEVQIGVFPSISLNDYTALIPSISLESITDSDIDNRLADIARANGPLIEVDRPLKDGDVANIDFEGFINGESFDGGKSEGFDLEIGSKRFIDSFESQLIGMVKGDIRNINVKFPDNYNAKDIAGRDAVFKVKLNKVQERSSANLDDDFAKIMLPNDNQASLAKLKDEIKIQLQNENKNKLFSDFRQPLIDSLLNGINFDLPQNIIDNELDIVFRNKLRDFSKDDLKDLQENKAKAEEEREKLRDTAKRSVKLTLLIDCLAKQLNISVSDNEVYEVVYYEALMTNKNPKELLDFYKDNNMFAALKITLLEGKVLNNLLESKLKND